MGKWKIDERVQVIVDVLVRAEGGLESELEIATEIIIALADAGFLVVKVGE